jgi:8-oxo-dGTP diphosphatase
MLSANHLVDVLSEIDWNEIRSQTRLPTEYNGFPSAALVAAHTLPYILPLQSERALSRELSERELLQEVCGFRSVGVHNEVPSRATLWHFRARHYGDFQAALLRGLVALVAQSRSLHVDLPFVVSVVEPLGHPPIYSFTLLRPAVEAQVHAALPPSRLPQGTLATEVTADQLSLLRPHFFREERRGRKRVPRERMGIDIHVGLPAHVSLTYPGSKPAYARLQPPPWLYRDLQDKDRLSALGSSYRNQAYTACNVLVLRKCDGEECALLATRLSGTGAGEWTLPGGKRLTMESLQACARRELKEETGMELRQSRPVSLHRREAASGAPVTSVGVLAEFTEGEPRRREGQHLGEWQWFPLHSLPENLFAPARLVLQAYLDPEAEPLGWEEVETAGIFDEPHLFSE